MPNLAKFREDPDAMLVMSLEDYDEATGKAAKAAIMQRTWSAARRRSRTSLPPRKGLLVSLDQRGTVDLAYIADTLRQARRRRSIAELGDLIYHDPRVEGLADRR